MFPCVFIHSLLALVNKRNITLVLSKQTSLASDHVNGSVIKMPTMQTPTMVDVRGSATATTNGYVSIYLSIYLSFVCFDCSCSRCVCFFRSTVHYQHQQRQHVLHQHLCHHEVLPSMCNWNTTAAATTKT